MSLSDRTHLGFLYGHFLNEGHWKLMVFQISWFLFLCTTQIWWFGMVFTCHVVESHQIDILWRQKRNQWNSLQECLASVETPDRKRRTGCPSWTCANNIIFIYIYIYLYIYMVLKRCDTPIYHHIPIYIYIYSYFVLEHQRHRYAHSRSSNILTNMRTNLHKNYIVLLVDYMFLKHVIPRFTFENSGEFEFGPPSLFCFWGSRGYVGLTVVGKILGFFLPAS